MHNKSLIHKNSIDNRHGKAPLVEGRTQGDHSPDNVKFPDGSRHSSAALGMLSVTHIMPVLVLLSVVGVGMQQYMIRNHIYLTFKTQQTPTKYL